AVDDGLELGQPAHAVLGRVVGHVEREIVVALAPEDLAVEGAGAGTVDGDVGDDRVVALAAVGLELQAAVKQARRGELDVVVTVAAIELERGGTTGRNRAGRRTDSIETLAAVGIDFQRPADLAG